MATILIVDDNLKNRNVLKDMVISFGHIPVLAEDGKEALAKMKEQPPDLVLLDILMPEMNGYEVLDHMKKNNNLRHIPVIMISAVDYIHSVIQCIEKGADDYLDKPFNPKLLKARMDSSLEKKRLRDQEKDHLKKLQIEKKRSDDLLTKIIPIGLGLFSETVFDRLLEKILLESMSYSNADAGTLYRRIEGNFLKFEIVRTNSLGIKLGGTSGKTVLFKPVPMYDEKTKEPNHSNIVTHAALTGSIVNIPDAYRAEGFNFSGTRAFDKQNNYRSTSLLTVPLVNSSDEVIGVFQLINALDAKTGKVVSFSKDQGKIIEILARLAAAALESYVREQKLKEQIKELRIEIDKSDRDKKVKEITESDYFQSLQEKIDSIKEES